MYHSSGRINKTLYIEWIILDLETIYKEWKAKESGKHFKNTLWLQKWVVVSEGKLRKLSRNFTYLFIYLIYIYLFIYLFIYYTLLTHGRWGQTIINSLTVDLQTRSLRKIPIWKLSGDYKVDPLLPRERHFLKNIYYPDRQSLTRISTSVILFIK